MGMVWVRREYGVGKAWVWHGMGMAWRWDGCRHGMDKAWVWARCGHGVGTVWARWHGMGTVWAQCGHGMGIVWARCGHGVGMVWAQYGHGVGTVLARAEQAWGWQQQGLPAAPWCPAPADAPQAGGRRGGPPPSTHGMEGDQLPGRTAEPGSSRHPRANPAAPLSTQGPHGEQV